jgi:hypothetical protein
MALSAPVHLTRYRLVIYPFRSADKYAKIVPSTEWARRPRGRGKTMIILNRDGTLEWILADCRSSKKMVDSIMLPDDLAEQHSNLFDQVFAFAFDVLGLVTVELRVRATERAPLERADLERWADV